MLQVNRQTLFEGLFGDDTCSGEIVIAGLSNGLYRDNTFGSWQDAEKYVQGKPDLYFKTARMDLAAIVARNPHGIGGKAEVKTISCVGLDIDCAGKDPKYPTKEAVIDYLRFVELTPSYVVASGGDDGTAGLHVYWVLENPVEVSYSGPDGVKNGPTDVSWWDALSRKMLSEMRAVLPGIDIGGTAERVLRAVGSVRQNGKTVSLVSNTGLRYTPGELLGTRNLIPPALTASKHASASGVILEYLKKVRKIKDVRSYLSGVMKWLNLGGGDWQHPGSLSGLRSGTEHVGRSGELGIRIYTNDLEISKKLPDGPGTNNRWFDLVRLFVYWEHGGSHVQAAVNARSALLALQPTPGAIISQIVKDEQTDAGMAYWLASIPGATEHRFVDEWGKWMTWDADLMKWRVDKANAEILRFVDAGVDTMPVPKFTGDQKTVNKLTVKFANWRTGYRNTRQQNGLMKRLQGMEDFAAKPADFHGEDTEIGCPSGELLRVTIAGLEEDFLTHRKLNSNLVGCPYDPAAVCPRWDQFLVEFTRSDSQLVEFLQRFAGYSLTGNVSEQKLVILFGAGANGKSVFTETLEHVMGDYAAVAAPSLLTGDSFADGVADTAGKRCVFASETESWERLRASRVKGLTSSGTIRTRRLYEQFWEFKPTAKIWLSTNFVPTIEGGDRGIWRRVVIVPCEADFTSSPDVELAGKLRAEASGILNWIIDGAEKWRAFGLGPLPQSIQAALVDHHEESDPIGSWMADRCSIKQGLSATSNELYKSFHFYCETELLLKRIPSHKALSDRLRKTPGVVKTRVTAARKWDGIGLK